MTVSCSYDSYDIIREAYSDKAMGQTTVYKWFRCLEEG
jgi:hypothetical protein